MTDPRQLTLTISLADGYGKVHGKLTREVPEDVAFMGERVADDFRSNAFVGAVNLNDAVKILKVREFRKELLIKSAKNMGVLLAEHLEDKEGWHGLKRQERILERQGE